MHGQLQPPPKSLLEPLLQPLLELREHYARQVEEYEALYKDAQSQLIHVEGLLSTWSGERPTDSHTPTVQPNVSVTISPSQNGVISLPELESIQAPSKGSNSLEELGALTPTEVEDSSFNF